MVKSSEFGVPGSLRLSLRVNSNATLLSNNLTALLVDSDVVSRMILEERLQSYRVATKCLESGSATINSLVSGETYDLIFIAMPLLDGFGPEVTRHIRAMGFKCRIIGVAHRDDERDKAAFLAAGANGLIEKPLNLSVLQAILVEVDTQI